MKKGQRRRARQDSFSIKRSDHASSRTLFYGDSITDEHGHYVVQYDSDETGQLIKSHESFTPHDAALAVQE